ncbi:MAG: MmgE/PrpD family protein [Chloroflexi bacterium]|nr:MmgE/PrpD family protein [Chloroflexota bacterium]
MTFTRDLAWQNLDLAYRSSVAHQFGRFALTLNYGLLPPDVVHQAKRSLLDALGCTMGAYEAPGRQICETLAIQLGGPEEATVFGSGLRTSAPNASLVNAFLVRFLDYNDFGGGGHNSDCIPSILAIAEREKAGGQDFLTSIVISYELGARVRECVIGASMAERGWTTDIRGGLSMPPALGKLMGLSEQQIANAIGVCASHSLPLGILDSHREENAMAKNLRFGFVAHNAILCCMLAKMGFTGPVRIVEGDSGLGQTILKGEIDLERLTDFSGWRILNTRHKSMCADGTIQGHIFATIAIVKEHDLKPDDIAAVRIKTGLRAWRHTTTPAKKYPRNAESADHSAFYGTAIAIKERAFGPASIEPSKFTDPIVLDLIEKITVEPDLGLPAGGRAGVSEITTIDGRRLQKRVDIPHGYGDDPLTDLELEDKFRDMAVKYMGDDQIRKIFSAVWNLEKLGNLSELTGLMVFKPSPC